MNGDRRSTHGCINGSSYLWRSMADVFQHTQDRASQTELPSQLLAFSRHSRNMLEHHCALGSKASALTMQYTDVLARAASSD